MPEKTEKNHPAEKDSARKAEKKTGEKSFAVVQVRGTVKAKKELKEALRFLSLGRQNRCVVVPATPSYLGMLQKVKDYVTWGEIAEENFQDLVVKRGKVFQGREMDRKGKYNYRFLDFKGKKYLPYFSLNPPRKGFERGGIKVNYQAGGALGYRGDKINDLLKRMC